MLFSFISLQTISFLVLLWKNNFYWQESKSNSENTVSAENTSISNNNNLDPFKTVKTESNCEPPIKKTVKPAVPPKPALPIKPKLTNNENSSLSQKGKDSTEPDSVNKALSFLKNKSSKKEKSDFR